MSDVPQGDGWWEASDGKWYAPELHPDYRPPGSYEPPPSPYEPPVVPQDPQVDPRLSGYQPPAPGDRLEMPAAGGFGHQGPPGHQRYPAVAPKSRSGGKIIAIVFGGIFLLMAGGCGVFIWAYRDEIADATVDFSNGVAVDDAATCAVIGRDFGEDYEIEATLSATSANRESHYLVDFEVLSASGRTLGVEDVVFRSMEPGEQRTEGVFNTISADDPIDTVTCNVTRILRTDA